MDDEGPMTLNGRAFLERIDKELAYVDVSRDEMRALLRELRSHICKLEGDVWAAEAGAGFDACIIGELRESARRVTGGNSTFADEDLGLLVGLAERAIKAGLTEGLHPSVLKSIAAMKRRKKPKARGRRGRAKPA